MPDHIQHMHAPLVVGGIQRLTARPEVDAAARYPEQRSELFPSQARDPTQFGDGLAGGPSLDLHRCRHRFTRGSFRSSDTVVGSGVRVPQSKSPDDTTGPGLLPGLGCTCCRHSIRGMWRSLADTRGVGAMPAGRGRIRVTIATIALVVLQSAVASAVHGQVVRGRLVDDGDNAAIAGAMVTLVGRDGRGVARMLTQSGTGVFELRVPAPGEYRLRAERIGYGTTHSAFFRISTRDTLTVQMAAPI
ncbi:MAG: carboxypeptidase regulatory-like domain-containing protein, partial [Gemmatimonadales bacterium]|nr:carboxypeptidase regulatory-like domain-containing protein [Candidatus Palauibacter denitrificans]